ncbi:CLUMA_CG017033, isoform A [Clunio marinus]|uniref:CLUMA_CG017033, isoform A n=1 Tax=Clunio marinus TaxID=568069 RepID=A0A1J1IUX6_9DIPT|nr:CLUMA_CG017033, isoform A [Clunio marinus]
MEKNYRSDCSCGANWCNQLSRRMTTNNRLLSALTSRVAYISADPAAYNVKITKVNARNFTLFSAIQSDEVLSN